MPDLAKPVSLIRRALPFLAIGVAAAIAYDAWVFYSRWHDARQAEQAQHEAEVRQARRDVDLLGGGGLKILTFYASPTEIRRGESANVCFGVTGAKSVRIEPPVTDLHPALSYCFQVTPHSDQSYKLTATDEAGHAATASLDLSVAR